MWFWGNDEILVQRSKSKNIMFMNYVWTECFLLHIKVRRKAYSCLLEGILTMDYSKTTQ